MKQDLDHLMQERGLDALVVAGKTHGNPALVYLANAAPIISGYVIKKRGQEPLLLCAPIEREEAAASGLNVVTTNRYDFEGIQRQETDRLAAVVELYRRVFADLDVSGKVGFYGMADQGGAWNLLNALDEQVEGVQVTGDFDPTLIDIARATKDAAEAGRIRQVGARAATIMGQTIEFLKSHAVRDGALAQADGTPLTIGRVHQEIRRFLAQQDLEVPEGVIFAIGRDAGVPHNKGNPEDVLSLGRSIIFDFGPRQLGGGYYFDMTRTFCLGYAPPEVERAYRDVYDCIHMLMGTYELGAPVRRYQHMACEFFESRGHPTIGTDTRTESGFVHGLGHGIGLAIHEEPFFSDAPSNTSVLQPGHIFTCEPGLYYPERGFGVRLEDVMWMRPDGARENLTDFPMELVISM
jgi:Xaa-Pro aminopeptidase